MRHVPAAQDGVHARWRSRCGRGPATHPWLWRTRDAGRDHHGRCRRLRLARRRAARLLLRLGRSRCRGGRTYGRAGPRRGLWPRTPGEPAGPRSRVRRDGARPRPGDDRAGARQRRACGPFGASTDLRHRRRRGTTVPGRLVRPRRQHALDAPLGRASRRAGRDRPGAAPRWPSPCLGHPAGRRAAPPPPARSVREHRGLAPPRRERDAVALAVAARVHPADRACLGRRGRSRGDGRTGPPGRPGRAASNG